MARQLSVKGIPDHLFEWLHQERKRRALSLKDVTVEVLREARDRNSEPDLFDYAPEFEQPKAVESLPFTFIDLFAGIGGFRLAFEKLGGRCLFTSEWDSFSQKTYRSWFGEKPVGDIRPIPEEEIPNHDVLCAGFPCQPFSIAGVSKKKSLGREHGFKDVTQGTLFFKIASIIEVKRPPVICLENVKNLRSHDKGQTWTVIKKTLEELDYVVFSEIIDGAKWVPQHRERIFIVGFDRKVFGSTPAFQFPSDPPIPQPKFKDILEDEVDPKYTLSDHLWNYLQEYAARHKAKGNGFGYGITKLEGVSRTLSARYYKDGSEILIDQSPDKNPRRLTPKECAKLMGFPDDLPIVVSDTQAYKQFGNAVIPKVVKAVGQEILKTMNTLVEEKLNNCLIKGRLEKASGKPPRAA